MADDLLKQINTLAKKKREEGLTIDEEKLQKELYKKYLKNFRESFSKQLDNVDVKYPDGTVVPLKDVPKKNKES